jgi:hypothetical protein
MFEYEQDDACLLGRLAKRTRTAALFPLPVLMGRGLG